MLTFLRVIRVVLAKDLSNKQLAKMRLAIYLEEGYRKSFKFRGEKITDCVKYRLPNLALDL